MCVLYIRLQTYSLIASNVIGIFYSKYLGTAFCERDSSGTTRHDAKRRAGDGADSPTRAPVGREAARPRNFASQNSMKNEK
jgi:hypothetical protein